MHTENKKARLLKYIQGFGLQAADVESCILDTNHNLTSQPRLFNHNWSFADSNNLSILWPLHVLYIVNFNWIVYF